MNLVTKILQTNFVLERSFTQIVNFWKASTIVGLFFWKETLYLNKNVLQKIIGLLHFSIFNRNNN